MIGKPRHGVLHFSMISCLVLQWLFLLLGTGYALALVGDTEGMFGLDGSFRSIGALAHNYENQTLFEKDTDVCLQSILRMNAAGHPAQQVSYEAHLVTAFAYSSVSDAGD